VTSQKLGGNKQMSSAATLLLMVIGTLMIWLLAKVYIEVRKGLNALMAAAQKDFSDAANAIMKTPADVPSDALQGLIFMGAFAIDRKTSWSFLQYLRSIDPDQREASSQPAWRSGLRPELKGLFDQAAGASFAIMINTFTFTGLLIRITMAQQSKSRRTNSKIGHGLGPVEGKILAFADQHHWAA
jgi:hypothetical protein